MTRSFVWCAAAFAVQHGNTALHIAVDVDTSLSQLLVAEVMRANPAQVVAQNNRGDTPLHVALKLYLRLHHLLQEGEDALPRFVFNTRLDFADTDDRRAVPLRVPDPHPELAGYRSTTAKAAAEAPSRSEVIGRLRRQRKIAMTRMYQCVRLCLVEAPHVAWMTNQVCCAIHSECECFWRCPCVRRTPFGLAACTSMLLPSRLGVDDTGWLPAHPLRVVQSAVPH